MSFEWLGPATAAGGPAKQVPGAADSLVPVTPGWKRVDAQDAPQHVREAAEGFEARVSGKPRQTTAVYEGRKLVSGGRERELADDLAYERIRGEGGRRYPLVPNVLYEHAEMKVAADMRRRKPANVEVVLDNSICGTRELDRRYPLTCDKLLPDAMPAGSRMTIWATVDGGNTFYRKIIEGTGSLVRP